MRAHLFAGLVLVAILGCSSRAVQEQASSVSLPPVAKNELRPVSAFSVISDQKERSRALFLESSRVLTHPRCINCHPNGDTPLQGMQSRPHDPPVFRGPADKGVVGMQCGGCHQDQNLDHARVPGAPNWHVAPLEMAWVGKSPKQICEQMKDKKRNGGKDLAAIVHHNAHDELVAWGWKPGHEREPAPGTQEQFGALISEWATTGAECPSEDARP